MELCIAVHEGCDYKDTLRAHRYYAPLGKYFTVCITYQPTLVYYYYHFKNNYREGEISHEIQTQILILLPFLHLSNSQNFSNRILDIRKTTVCNFQC